MSKVIIHRTTSHFVMSRYHLFDKRLSLSEKGLLSLLFYLTDNENYCYNDLPKSLAERVGDSESEVRQIIGELCEHGYLVDDGNGGYEIREKPVVQRGE